MPKKSKTKSSKQRVKVSSLSPKSKTLTAKEAKKLKGGYSGGVQVAAGDVNSVITGAGPGGGPHIISK